MSEDWTAYDAENVLALPLFRIARRAIYRREGKPADTREDVYSNGIDHEVAVDDAVVVLDHGPMLRRVLHAGVRALAEDEAFQRYVAALASGDHEAIVAEERAAREGATP